MKTPTTVVSCTLRSTRTVMERQDFSVAECKMVVEYRHKIESGEIKEWEIGQE